MISSRLRMVPFFVALGLPVCVGAQVPVGPGKSESAPSRVEITCDFDAPALVARLREAIEAAVPLYEDHLGVKLPADQRLIVHLYRTIDAYAAAVTKDGAASLIENRAATTWGTHESYAVVQPSTEPEFLAHVGDLPELLRCIVLHEVAHQFAWKTGMFPPKFLPSWYAEGQADWLAWKAIIAGRTKASPPVLYYVQYAQAVADANRETRLPSLDALLGKGFDALPKAEAALVYTVSWSLYGFLSDRANAAWNSKFVAFQKELRRRGQPGSDTAPDPIRAEIDKLFRKTFPDLKALDQAWKKQAPGGEWSPIWRSAELRGDEIVCAVPPGAQNSLVMRNGPLSAKGFTISGELILHAGGGQQAEITLWRVAKPDTTVKLAVGGAGYLTVMGYRDGTWTTFGNANGPPPTLGGDQWHTFEVTFKDARVNAKVDGRTVDVTVPDGWIKGEGRWGVGAYQSVARFRRLQVK